MVNDIKVLVKSTFNKNVLSGIGHFGSFYRIEKKKYQDPVLVSSVDGVGTKLKIAFAMDKHDTVGQDLVNHCVNDIAVCGAKPLYFMDYLAFGKLNLGRAQRIIEGFTIACKENGVALIGGETAEMPGLYDANEYDMSGTVVGIVEKKKIINGTKVKKGNVLIGFTSNGLHTNGYSLARRVLLDKFTINDKPDILDRSIGEELLKVHKSYLKLVKKLIKNINVKAFSHITGGGIVGNTKRVVPSNLQLKINWSSWDIPNIFKLIQATGDISDSEMRKVFNLGIGLIAIVKKADIGMVMKITKSLKEKAFIIGKVV
ncbi:MAG: phosphoribosylformylglycinamidine cyclo-ligase [Ignavibacteria bacterium RBG_13_36_8]|nr:MAG: phosphoribosylformylglycinamidine cyclo-ligase [Ignavibacteria bacterium RBG_13_36_8]